MLGLCMYVLKKNSPTKFFQSKTNTLFPTRSCFYLNHSIWTEEYSIIKSFDLSSFWSE